MKPSIGSIPTRTTATRHPFAALPLPPPHRSLYMGEMLRVAAVEPLRLRLSAGRRQIIGATHKSGGEHI